MPKELPGQLSSAEVRQKIKEDDMPVILSFSRGKDSLAAWLALRDDGIEVLPFFMYNPPGLQFINESIEYYENYFDTEIRQYPHQSLYTQLCDDLWQPPSNINFIVQSLVESLENGYQTVNDWARYDFGLPDAWVVDGVRAVDSPMRFASAKKYGFLKPKTRTASVVGDWYKRDVMGRINAEPGLKLPVDYEMWGRSYDGTDKRFTEPLKERFPEDYERLKVWFPLLEADQLRWQRKDG